MARFRHRISAPAAPPQEETVFYVTRDEERGKTRNPTGESQVSTEKLPCWMTFPGEKKKKTIMVILHNYYSVTNAPRCPPY